MVLALVHLIHLLDVPTLESLRISSFVTSSPSTLMPLCRFAMRLWPPAGAVTLSAWLPLSTAMTYSMGRGAAIEWVVTVGVPSPLLGDGLLCDFGFEASGCICPKSLAVAWNWFVLEAIALAGGLRSFVSRPPFLMYCAPIPSCPHA